MTNNPPCPVCARALSRPPNKDGDRSLYTCGFCGEYGLSGTTDGLLPSLFEVAPRRRTVFAFFVRRIQETDKWPVVQWEVAKQVLDADNLPSPQQQADNLIRWLGKTTADDPGKSVALSYGRQGAIVGSASGGGFSYIVEELIRAGFVQGTAPAPLGSELARLTFKGWGRYEELQTGSPSGRAAFMAMKFGEAVLTELVASHFVPAVLATGFQLKRLDDTPKAGLIDDRLRVEIKACRFLIADLTHANNGAYWEAGYAEGLGKPVIYTCESLVFKSASHFDTNHHLTVLWEAGAFEDAARRLADTIRATIPEASRAKD